MKRVTAKRSPKMNAAIQYLYTHPENRNKSGRWLERYVNPLPNEFDSIAYYTWSEAKKIMSQPNFGDEQVFNLQTLPSENAVAYLHEHPELHGVGAKRLAVIVSDPKCSHATWRKAREILGLPPVDISRPNSTAIVKPRKRTTVEVDMHKQEAVVLHNDQRRVYDISKMKRLTFDGIVEFYKGIGYEVHQLTEGVVRFVKPTNARKEAA